MALRRSAGRKSINLVQASRRLAGLLIVDLTAPQNAIDCDCGNRSSMESAAATLGGVRAVQLAGLMHTRAPHISVTVQLT